MAASRTLPLRDRQRAVIESALRAPVQLRYAGPDDANVEHAPWQVLVLDTFARNMLSAILNPRDLRRHGIALSTQIDAPRASVPDAPALYLVAPTPENVAWLLKDIQVRGLYDRVSIAFTSSASVPLLSALADQLPIPTTVARVQDLHASFMSLEQNLFSLAMRNSFVELKAIDSEDALEKYVQPIVSGLLSVFVTLGLVPIIRAQRGGAAAAVASALSTAIRDNLDLFQKSNRVSALAFRRPLLLLMDRDFDFSAMLYHTWTYQALVHDSFSTSLNVVTVPARDSREEAKYELDKSKDTFWADNARAPFPEVAQSIENAISQYRSDVETINQRAGSKDVGGAGETSTSALAHAVSSLPELAERKQTIDVHTNIATAVLEEIDKRALDTFFELESQILNTMNSTSSSASASEYKNALLELLRGERETSGGDKRGAGSPDDRLRLFLIFYLAFGSQLSEDEMTLFRSILTNAGASLDPVRYVQKLRGFRHDVVTAPIRDASSTSKRAMLRGLMSNVVSRGYRGIASVAKNARNFVLENRQALPSASVLKLFVSDRARMANPSSNDILDNYHLFDPKVERDYALGEDDASRQKAKRMLFSDAIVFVVGGGSYVEFDDCVSAVESCPDLGTTGNIIYGSTEIMNAAQFLNQLCSARKDDGV